MVRRSSFPWRAMRSNWTLTPVNTDGTWLSACLTRVGALAWAAEVRWTRAGRVLADRWSSAILNWTHPYVFHHSPVRNVMCRDPSMSLENTHSNVLIRSPTDQVHQMVPCTPAASGKACVETGYGEVETHFAGGQVSDDDSGDFFLDCSASMDLFGTRKSAKSHRRKGRLDEREGYLFGSSDEDAVSGEIQLTHVDGTQILEEENSQMLATPKSLAVGKRRKSTVAAAKAAKPTRPKRGEKTPASLIDMVAPPSSQQSQKSQAGNTRTSSRKAVKTPITKKMGKRGGSSNRKPQVPWIKGRVLDPRTGEELTTGNVPPGEFCTQCNATTTPVWRAGPFGHKTLCNACGVRWMKNMPRRR
jgi:hypothetical protein